jgi:hypothetical protein
MTMTNDDPIVIVWCLVATSLAVTWYLLQGQKGTWDGTCLPGLGTTPSLSDEGAHPLMCCIVAIALCRAGGGFPCWGW